MTNACYDPASPTYWDADHLEGELRRIFDICHGCRLCYNLCPSFPHLLNAIDATESGDLDEVPSRPVFDEVVELCFNCKLCFPKCPYTPPHDFQLDFPRLMLRSKALKARAEGIPLRDRLFCAVDATGKIGTKTAGLANWANRFGPARLLMEKVLGIHRRAALPAYAAESFAEWFGRVHGRQTSNEPTNGKVALFATCSLNYNDPETARAAVSVLTHNGLQVALPSQRCCGMPALDKGDVEGARRAVKENVASFATWVRNGYAVVVLGPTCGYMMRKEFPVYLQTEEACLVAEAARDFSEYLMGLHAQGKLKTDFAGGPSSVAYHLPCHLKAQNIGFKSRDLMNLLPDGKVTMVDRCCGMDGLWGLQAPHYETSLKVGQRLFRSLQGAEAEVTVSDCPLAQHRIAEATALKPIHPAVVLRDAYGLAP